MKSHRAGALSALVCRLASPHAGATSLEKVAARLDVLMAENAQLKARIEQLEHAQTQTEVAVPEARASTRQ